MKRSFVLLSLSIVATIGIGCGQESSSPRENRAAESASAVKMARAEPVFAANPAGAPAPAEQQQPRKIIYNANVDLVVDAFDKAQEQLTQLVKDNNGYVARSDTRGETGAPRSGEWTLRVPVDRFRGFIADLSKLGEVRESKTDSDDVTDRYYDVKAHIQNDKAEEESLRKLMVDKSATGKLEDLLAVRRELRELRGQIEAQQGQMERWDKEAAMTAVVVQMQDRKDYVPAITPSFASSISRTFTDSIGALMASARGVVLVIVAAAPWLAVLFVPILGLWWLNRKWLRKLMVRSRTLATRS